jgi:DNA-binding CsgD family transcriptional regulator
LGGSVTVGFTDLLEREDERVAALAALDHALGGDGVAIAFVATAGVGKTSLVRALGTEARARGARTLSARGIELEHGLAFGLAGQLFTPALAAAVGEERERLLGGTARLAGSVLGLAPGTPTPDAALHGLYWLCANLCDDRPLVLVVDDAHWADAASLRFLVHLVHRFDGLPLLLAVAARPAEPGIERELLDALLQDEGTRVCTPQPLSSAATAQLVRRHLGSDAAHGLCSACHAATGGNPFLVGELVDALRREGVDPASADATAVDGIGPPAVARSVLVRLGRLTDDAIALARAVAIFPEGAEFRHLVALAGIDERSAAGAANALVEMAILARGRPMTFLHPMMRSAVYRDLPEASRALLHLDAVRLLRAEGADPATIATHLLATEPGMDPGAFADLMAAAGAALMTGAPDAALRYLDRALLEPVPAPATASARHLRGLAAMLVGSPTALGDLQAALDASRADDPSLLRDLARVYGFGFQTTEAAALLDRAIAACAGSDPDLQGRCMIDRIWILWGHEQTGSRYASEMLATQVAAEPETLLEHALAGFKACWKAYRCEDADEAVAFARRALAGGVLLAEAFDGLPPIAFAACALALCDEPQEALTTLAASTQSQRETGSAMGLTYMYMVTGLVRIYAGELADAESDLRLGLELTRGQLAGRMGELSVLPLLAVVALERQGPPAADELLAGLEADPTWVGIHLLAARGHIHLAAGRFQAAIEDLTRTRRLCEARGQVNPLYPLPWRGDLALATAASGDRHAALQQAQDDLANARRFGAAGVLGECLRVAGLLARGDDRLVLLSESAKVLAGSSARLLHAQTLADLGAALRRDNHRVAARDPLRLAIDLAHRCGSVRLETRAGEELRAAGGRPRRTFVTGVDALTPSERRVARLAAAGFTNREIAQQLYLTVKTVEMHVGNALSKLGIASRRQFEAALEGRSERTDPAAAPAAGLGKA